jgi:carbamate kinase
MPDEPGRPDIWVVAIGGNALADPHDPQDLARQEERAEALAVPLGGTLAGGVRLLIVHGNGPQVGARLIQDDAAADRVPPSPLHVCVAETQGQMGHYLSLALLSETRSRGLDIPIVALVTHVTVDPIAPEFKHPGKPVGPVYEETEARSLAASRGWTVARVAGGGWRRVVPSPRPTGVLELAAIEHLLSSGACVVAGGGGGIPLTAAGTTLRCADAVVDKDYVASMLATALGASRLVVLTDVPGAALAFTSGAPRFQPRMAATEARLHLQRGEFAPGSMAPKVEACADFVERGGEEAVIAATADAAAALAGATGTRIHQ